MFSYFYYKLNNTVILKMSATQQVYYISCSKIASRIAPFRRDIFTDLNEGKIFLPVKTKYY